MPNLGDFFPDDLKKQFVADNFKIGAVLRYGVSFTTPPKFKRSIIVGFDRQKSVLGIVLINSEINPRTFPAQHLKDLHLELNEIGRDYLDHTSFVDCSKIFEQDIEEVKNLVRDTPSVHLGALTDQDLIEVLNKIKSAKTISLATKEKFGLI